jgi:hypothetical protein
MYRVIFQRNGPGITNRPCRGHHKRMTGRVFHPQTFRANGRKKQISLFLEADRSTMSHQRMAMKIAGCLAHDHQERYRSKYPGMKSFLVATVGRLATAQRNFGTISILSSPFQPEKLIFSFRSTILRSHRSYRGPCRFRLHQLQYLTKPRFTHRLSGNRTKALITSRTPCRRAPQSSAKLNNPRILAEARQAIIKLEALSRVLTPPQSHGSIAARQRPATDPAATRCDDTGQWRVGRLPNNL